MTISTRRRRAGAAVALLALVAGLMAPGAAAQEREPGFVVRDIRIEGLGRITEGAVFNYLPINIGDRMTPSRLQETLRAVYSSGFFVDAELRRDGDALVIAVRERPAIASFEIEGNKDIKTEDLEENLRGVGLAAGLSFDRSVLEDVKQFLTSEYYNRGKYGAKVDTEVTDLGDNRVNVKINIKEGPRAQIKQINIVGNTVFDDEELLDQFKLRTPNFLSWIRKDDRYSREELEGDIETLNSYYMDRGYANFAVTSTQVAISPDKKDVYITLNLREGDTYEVSDVKLSGDLVVTEEELMSLVLIKPGQTFSRKLMTQTNELISFRLGSEGFANAEVQPIPDIDVENRTVSLDMRVIPGERVYVRNIRFKGTDTVNDAVFRREMRQMESGWLSNTLVERSKERLQRLPFIEKVDFETIPVSGSSDLVDVEFDIEEGLPGQFGGGLGYSQTFGISINGNFTHTNFLGRGERVSADINAGDFSKVYSLSHTNPYATVDGISRTVGLSYADTTQLSTASSRFVSEILSASLEYGLPLSEYSRLSLGAVIQDSQLEANSFGSQQGLTWINNNGSPFDVINQDMGPCGTGLAIDAFGGVVPSTFDVCGTKFQALELFAGWVYDSRDRFLFPRRGLRQRLSLSMTSPGSDVEYWVADYNFTGLWPVFGNFILGWNVDLSFGEDLGETTALPPYKNFFAGGPDSVRGFRQSRLGPIDSLGNTFGGNLKTVSQFSLIVPTPEKLAASTRISLFYDVGNVFSTGDTRFRERYIGNVAGTDPSIREIPGRLIDYGFSTDALRHSTGIAVEWLAPLGTFRFSYAVPLNAEDDVIRTDADGRQFLTEGDELERFQFSIGRSF